ADDYRKPGHGRRRDSFREGGIPDGKRTGTYTDAGIQPGSTSGNPAGSSHNALRRGSGKPAGGTSELGGCDLRRMWTGDGYTGRYDNRTSARVSGHTQKILRDGCGWPESNFRNGRRKKKHISKRSGKQPDHYASHQGIRASSWENDGRNEKKQDWTCARVCQNL